MNTRLAIEGTRFLINGSLTYSEIPGCESRFHGLLMNARFIQGIYDDQTGYGRYERFGRTFNPDTNTDDLIAALPQWYAAGLRAFTVGLQGGGPCFTIDNYSIQNTPFSPDGDIADERYLDRLGRLIVAADKIGMVVIVSLFYGAQSRFLRNNQAVENAVRNSVCWLKGKGFTNVIVEIANECDVKDFSKHTILSTEYGIRYLIDVAHSISDFPVGCSGTGGYFSSAIAEVSDVILIHGNDQSRSRLNRLIQKAKAIRPARPVVVNEDSPAISQLSVTFDQEVSWGYYNNWTKQEPPADWTIRDGADAFFAARMAKTLGIKTALPSYEYSLDGADALDSVSGNRFISVSCMYPENIEHVEYWVNGSLAGKSYDDPFFLVYDGNWFCGPYHFDSGDELVAKLFFHDGTVKELKKIID